MGLGSEHRGPSCGPYFRGATFLLQACFLTQKDTTESGKKASQASIQQGDLLGGPVVMSLPSSAEDAGPIPGQRTRIPHATRQLSLCGDCRAHVHQRKRSPHAAAGSLPVATHTPQTQPKQSEAKTPTKQTSSGRLISGICKIHKSP